MIAEYADDQDPVEPVRSNARPFQQQIDPCPDGPLGQLDLAHILLAEGHVIADPENATAQNKYVLDNSGASVWPCHHMR